MMDAAREDPRTIHRLEETVDLLAARVAALEARLGLAADAGPAAGPDAGVDPGSTAPAEPVASSLGFTFLMIAGAYLLRAFTGSGALDGAVGLGLGLVYALGLLWPTRRAAADGRRVRASLFGLACVLVAYPLIWETATRLGLLPPIGAAVAIALVTGLGLALALRHDLVGLAWAFLLAALATLYSLFWAAGASILFAGVVTVLGIVVYRVDERRGWPGARWVTASAANVLTLAAVALAHPTAGSPARGPRPDPEAALWLALGLAAVYLGAFILKTLVRGRAASAFEVAQTLGCLLFGYAGAVVLLRAEGVGTVPLGAATLPVAALGYAAAFTRVQRRQGRSLSFFYHAWLGLLLTLLGTALVVPGDVLPWLWGGLALAVAVAGGRYDRWTLRLHCAAYLVGAAVLTDLPGAVFDAFVAPADAAWRRPSGAALAVWLAAAIGYALLVATHRRCELTPWRRMPRVLIASVALSGAGALLVGALVDGPAGGLPGSDAAIAAAVRTTVLAGTAVLLAWAARRPAAPELAWFVNPLLVLTGLKLLLEDLRRGTPVSLFLGFAVYGIALIVASRLRRARPADASDPQPGTGEASADVLHGETHGA